MNGTGKGNEAKEEKKTEIWLNVYIFVDTPFMIRSFAPSTKKMCINA